MPFCIIFFNLVERNVCSPRWGREMWWLFVRRFSPVGHFSFRSRFLLHSAKLSKTSFALVYRKNSPPMGTRDEVVICPQVPSRWSVTQRLFMICPLRGHYILNCVKRNMISVAPTALFYLWGSFIRGLHPCLCYFVPPGLCFVKFL